MSASVVSDIGSSNDLDNNREGEVEKAEIGAESKVQYAVANADTEAEHAVEEADDRNPPALSIAELNAVSKCGDAMLNAVYADVRSTGQLRTQVRRMRDDCGRVR